MDELVDYAILPQSRIQHYEDTISQQKSEIEKLQEQHPTPTVKEVDLAPETEDFANDKTDKTPEESLSDTVTKEPNEMVKVQEVETEPLPKNKVVEDVKIEKGKNINKHILARQLKHKLEETDFSIPTNVDELIKSAIGGSKKMFNNEKEFYQAIIDNNLIGLVRNPHKFKTYLRGTFFKI